MWAALLLPPVIQPQNWEWRSQVTSLTAKAARRVEIIDSRPLNFGEVYLSKDRKSLFRIDFENVNSKSKHPRVEFLNRNQLGDSKPRFQPSSMSFETLAQNRSIKISSKLQESSFELADDKLSYFPNGFNKPLLWFAKVGGSHWTSLKKSSSGGYLGLDPVEGLVMTLLRNRDRLLLYQWDRESQLINYFPCDGGNDVLVENVPSLGLSRLVFFVDGKPRSFTVFDFSGSARNSEITWAESFDCRDFIVGGNFGISRVRY